MIEVVLAMAIIAFGMTSILGLFPVGLNALKSSMADNYCSDSIDQMVGYLKNQAEYSPATFSKLTGDFTTAGGLPTAAELKLAVGADRSGVVNGKKLDDTSGHPPNDHPAAFLSDYRANALDDYPEISDWNIYQVPRSGTAPYAYPLPSSPYVYFIIQGAQGLQKSRNIDFSAMLLVWKSAVTYNMNVGSVPTSYTDTAYAQFAGINFEVSWPLEKPYAQREKRYYYVEVKRP